MHRYLLVTAPCGRSVVAGIYVAPLGDANPYGGVHYVLGRYGEIGDALAAYERLSAAIEGTTGRDAHDGILRLLPWSPVGWIGDLATVATMVRRTRRGNLVCSVGDDYGPEYVCNRRELPGLWRAMTGGVGDSAEWGTRADFIAAHRTMESPVYEALHGYGAY